MKVLIIVRGIPGSGKSTLATKIASCSPGFCRPIEADNYMVDDNGKYAFDPKRLGYCHGRCLTDVENAMIRGDETVIQSNTNITFKEMAPYLGLAERYGYQVQTIIVQANFGSVHGVPADKLAQMKARFQFTA